MRRNWAICLIIFSLVVLITGCSGGTQPVAAPDSSNSVVTPETSPSTAPVDQPAQQNSQTAPEQLAFYERMKEYKADLDGDQKMDTFILETDSLSYVNLCINEWGYSVALEPISPELLYKNYKLVKIEGTNKYAFALYVASPPDEEEIYFLDYENKGYDKFASGKKEAEELRVLGHATIDMGLFNYDSRAFFDLEMKLSRDQVTIGGHSFVFQQNPKDSPEPLLTFAEVYDGTHLTQAIEYFNENYDVFSKEQREDFAQELVGKIHGQAREIFNVIVAELLMGEYTLEGNSLSINAKGDQYLLDALKELESTQLLILARTFWASSTDGVYENQLKLTIHPEQGNKLKKALDIVYPEGALTGYHDLEPIIIPNVHYTSLDQPFNSFEAVEKGYAQVYIEDSEQLKLFDNENVWKTTLVLPVKINYN